MGILTGLGSMFFWGAAIFLAALASRKIGNILTLFWMEIFGLLLGIVYLLFSNQTVSFDLIIKSIPVILVIALLQMTAYLAFYKGLEKGQVSLVSPIGASWGLVVALLGVIFYKEVLKSNQILAIILIIVGVIAISINIKELIKTKKFDLRVGVKEGVIALLGWGVSLFLLVTPTKDLNWFLPAFLFRISLLGFLGVYLLISKSSFIPSKGKFPFWLLLLIGLFDMGAFMSYSYGVSNANSSVVGPIGSAYAVVTILLAKVVLKEKWDLSKIIGICSIVIGLIVIAI